MRYKSFMLIGACSTPISTSPVAGAGGFGKVCKLEDDSRLAERSHRTARILRLPC